VRVGAALRRVPLRELRRGVVAGLEGDLELAGLPVLLLQHVRDRLRHLDGLRPRTADERQVCRDQVISLAGPPVLDGATGGRRQCGHALAAASAAALLASSAAARRREGQQPDGDEEYSHRQTFLQLFLLRSPDVPLADRLRRAPGPCLVRKYQGSGG